MRQFAKLFFPEKAEIIFILSLAAGLLALLNIKRFWLVVEGSTAVAAVSSKSLENIFISFLQRLDRIISPNWLDFIMWLIIGCVGFLVFSVIAASVKSAENEAEILHYYTKPQGRHHEIIALMSRFAVRLLGVLGGVVWFYAFIGSFLPFSTKLFFTSVTTLPDLVSVFWLLVSIIITGATVYGFMIFIRLILLKSRVF